MRPQISPTRRAGFEAGFTLIELMIVVAIIGVLAAIAYPSYQDQVRKGRRAGAQTVMQAISTKQEQYLLEARQYADKASMLGVNTSEIDAYYTISITTNAAGDPPTYVVKATATGGQAKDGDLALEYKGVKTPADKWK